jgi:hypothetical protein
MSEGKEPLEDFLAIPPLEIVAAEPFDQKGRTLEAPWKEWKLQPVGEPKKDSPGDRNSLGSRDAPGTPLELARETLGTSCVVWA